MPRLHQDKSTRLNLERNLRHGRKYKKAVEWKEYEPAEDDIRPIADPKLEWEADKSGMIHSRKGTSKTEFLKGYGISNFGISPFEKASGFSPSADNILWTTGITAAGALIWRFRKNIKEGIETITHYYLLWKESSKKV